MQLASDKGLDHLDGAVRLRTWLNNPAVLGARKDLIVYLTASRLIRRNEALLHRGEHVVIQFPLQDEHGRSRDGFATFEDALRVGIDDGVPRIEIRLAVGDEEARCIFCACS